MANLCVNPKGALSKTGVVMTCGSLPSCVRRCASFSVSEVEWLLLRSNGSKAFDSVGEGLIVTCGWHNVREFLYMGGEGGAKAMFGRVSSSFGNRCKGFFVSCPDVFIKSVSRCVAGRTNALETCFVSALINGAALGDGILGTGCVCAENDFCPPIDMAVRE